MNTTFLIGRGRFASLLRIVKAVQHVGDRARPLVEREYRGDFRHPFTVRLLALGEPRRECSTRGVCSEDFDAFYADRLREPETGDQLIVLSFDDKPRTDPRAASRCPTRKAGAARTVSSST
ncbi:MAG: hypothetical protein ABI467_19175 [Kofleriaceae bacterium]